MGLVDQAEQLGAAVDAGLMPRAEAERHLMEYSDGGLTLLGASDLISSWQTCRATYSGSFDRAREGYRRLGGDPDNLPED